MRSTDPIEAVSQRLDQFFSAQVENTARLGEEAALLVRAGADAVAGGKRLRARFCLAGWRAAAGSAASQVGPVPDAVIAAAGALEIFHAAALVHDDLIDNSDTRRGRPAAHRALETLHGQAGWHGDADAFGRAGAVLLGDLLVAWSDDLFEDGLQQAPAPHAIAARAEYGRMRREVTIGQFLDIAEESSFTVAPDQEHAARALRVASLKSARYSVQQPLVIGAALAGAAPAPQAALAAFGHAVGMAFQLRDDVLGVFGDAVVTGKPSGDDLREGKRTVLVAYAREAMDADVRAAFDARLGDPHLDADEIGALQQLIRESGALERTEALIAEYATAAEAVLQEDLLGAEALSELRELARAATVRSS
ncbi:geranylgeranyl pyrophosphate synthase [Microbacterium mangrovi]|uniref:Geranylgeranyl pyrophosphate synthase n=1 Tax=Microbacterium mangrovi TaxID=1348253 RepID=A0A0B2A5X3_9MICO|nr:polyprenyl synthetase family protein [Microbacterium mangrovi]KHK96958.1 geranylgeranyl pyrophosphate synthase [Microbacterium mangrovi]